MIPQLYDDETGVNIEPELGVTVDGERFDTGVPDELAVRRLLIALAQANRRAEKLESTRAAVTQEYGRSIDREHGTIDRLRDTLRGYVLLHGNVSFPDVGGVHSRKTGPRVAVVDKDVVLGYFAEQGWPVPDKTEVDWSALRTIVLQATTEDGLVVPGVEFTPEGRDITVTGAK